MKVRDWERDILNRQRNIVFPDTMLNEVRFYRHIIANKVKLNPVQRAGVLTLAAGAFIFGSVGVVSGIIAARDAGAWLAGFIDAGPGAGILLIAFLLAKRALTAAAAPPAPTWWLKQQSRRRI